MLGYFGYKKEKGELSRPSVELFQNRLVTIAHGENEINFFAFWHRHAKDGGRGVFLFKIMRRIDDLPVVAEISLGFNRNGFVFAILEGDFPHRFA